jgi:hypothetical protein
MTIPGVNYVMALGLLAALGDIDRFHDGDHAASYLGLVPSTKQSGRHCDHGPITKAGSTQVRGLLTQAAQHASRHPGPIGAFFRRLVKRKSRQVAVTAVARKLVTVAYRMLKNNEPYRYARPELMRAKFATLRARDGVAPEAPGPTAPADGRRRASAGGVRGGGLAAREATAGAARRGAADARQPGDRRIRRRLYEAAGSDPDVRGPGRPTAARRKATVTTSGCPGGGGVLGRLNGQSAEPFLPCPNMVGPARLPPPATAPASALVRPCAPVSARTSRSWSCTASVRSSWTCQSLLNR